MGVKAKTKAKAASGAHPRAVREAAVPPAGFDLVDMLGQAGWAEADEALAQSLQDFQGLSDSIDTLAAKAHALDAAFQDLSARVLLARQSLEHVARRRGFERFGEIGVIEQFDPRRHDLAESPLKAPSLVRVRVQGVARGHGPKAAVLIKAAAERAPEPQKTPTKSPTKKTAVKKAPTKKAPPKAVTKAASRQRPAARRPH